MAAALAVFLAAFLPRAAYLIWTSRPFVGEYRNLSTALLADGSLAADGVRTTRIEPLYPLFLAAARTLTLNHMLLVQLVQAAVASLGGVGIFLLALELTGRRRVAWIAAALYAADPLLIRHASDGSDSALLTVLLIFFVYLFVRADTPRAAASAGVLLGLAVLTRAMTLPLFPVAAIVLLRRRGPACAVWLAGATALVVAPLIVRDYALTGSALPARQGVNLFIGNSSYTASLMPAHTPDVLQPYAYMMAARELPELDTDSVEFLDKSDAILSRLAWQEMFAHPAATLALKVKNVFYFFSPFLVPSRLLLPETSVVLGADGQISVLNAPLRPFSERLTFGLESTVILLAAAVGAYVRRDRLRRDEILWWALLVFALVYALYFPATRYGAPVRFVLLFYAAVAFAAI